MRLTKFITFISINYTDVKNVPLWYWYKSLVSNNKICFNYSLCILGMKQGSHMQLSLKLTELIKSHNMYLNNVLHGKSIDYSLDIIRTYETQ